MHPLSWLEGLQEMPGSGEKKYKAIWFCTLEINMKRAKRSCHSRLAQNMWDRSQKSPETPPNWSMPEKKKEDRQKKKKKKPPNP